MKLANTHWIGSDKVWHGYTLISRLFRMTFFEMALPESFTLIACELSITETIFLN